MLNVKWLFVPMDAAAYRTAEPISGMDFLLERITTDKWRLTPLAADGPLKPILVEGEQDPDWREVAKTLQQLAPAQATTPPREAIRSSNRASTTHLVDMLTMFDMLGQTSPRHLIQIGDFVFEIEDCDSQVKCGWSDETVADREFDLDIGLMYVGFHSMLVVGPCSPHRQEYPVLCIVNDAKGGLVYHIGNVKEKDGENIFFPHKDWS